MPGVLQGHLIGLASETWDKSSHFYLDLEETFALFDIDGNGRISSHELIAVLKSVGTQYSEEDIKEMHKIADLDGKWNLFEIN